MTPPYIPDEGVVGFKIADWPLHGRSDIWTWGDGIRLAESARAELRGSTIGPASDVCVSFHAEGSNRA